MVFQLYFTITIWGHILPSNSLTRGNCLVANCLILFAHADAAVKSHQVGLYQIQIHKILPKAVNE